MKSFINERDCKVYNQNEIYTSLEEEVSPRNLAHDIMGFDVVAMLRSEKDDIKKIEVESGKAINDVFLRKLTKNEGVRINAPASAFIKAQSCVKNYERNRISF